jgi:ribosomal protein S18 acetylase RimI-like enzyme
MIKVRLLKNITINELKRVAPGYTSDFKYVVLYKDSENHALIDLHLVPLETPYIKKYGHHNKAAIDRYKKVLKEGYSFGAYDDDLLVGLLIAERRAWNQSLWVWEFHTAESIRHLGVGKKLMDAVTEKAREEGIRVIICETQNTNADAIKIYRHLGFRVEAIDISYYSNDDYPDGEIAVFMKRRL